MKRSELLLIPNELVSVDEKHRLDEMVGRTIEQYKDNSAQIARFTVDSVTALAVVESRMDELESQSFLKRTFRTFSGKNRGLEANVSYNLRNAQYAAQKTLLKLAEQNLLTFDVLTAVNSKLNAYIISNSLEINELYFLLLQFIKETRGNVLKTENRIADLDRRVELLRWASTAEYATFEETLYSELDIASQVVCLTNDFYTFSKGEWDTTDLSLIKSILKDLGKDWNQKISFSIILQRLVNDTSIMNMIDETIKFENISEYSLLEIPMIQSIYKAKRLLTDEKYLVHTLSKNLYDAGIEKSTSELTIELSLKYIKEIGMRDLALEQPIFELVNELLIEMKVLNNFVHMDKELMLLETRESTQQTSVAKKEEELYEVIVLDYEMDKFELTMLLTELLEVDVREANQLLDDKNLLNRLISGISKSRANEINDVLNENQVNSIVNMIKIPLRIVFLDVSKMKELILKTRDYPFDFSKKQDSSFNILNIERGTIIEPHSVIGALNLTSWSFSGPIPGSNFEIFVANFHGEVIKSFQNIKDIAVDSENDEKNQKVPLFCARTVSNQNPVFNRSNFYSVFQYMPTSVTNIHINELYIQNF